MIWLVNGLIKFDCYDFARIRFHYHWYAMTGKCFREDICYDVVSCDVLSLIVSKLRRMTLFLWWKQYTQITFVPESGMNSNHNNCVKILAKSIRSYSNLASLSYELSSDYNWCSVFWICEMNWSNPVMICLIETIVIKINRSCLLAVQGSTIEIYNKSCLINPVMIFLWVNYHVDSFTA